MEQTLTGTDPQFEASIARLKSVASALEKRISSLIEKSGHSDDLHAVIDSQKHELHLLKQQVASLQEENSALKAKATEAEARYTSLYNASQSVQGQIDSAVNSLQLLLEKETVES